MQGCGNKFQPLDHFSKKMEGKDVDWQDSGDDTWSLQNELQSFIISISTF